MILQARKEVEKDAAFLAYHDPLTGLPSRSMFDELLQLSVARARRREGPDGAQLQVGLCIPARV